MSELEVVTDQDGASYLVARGKDTDESPIFEQLAKFESPRAAARFQALLADAVDPDAA